MTCSIIYSSKTGNTAHLAEKIKSMIKEGQCIYYGKPDELAKEADIMFVGFWTDKGNCEEELGCFLEGLCNKKIFLFGTAGFGGSEAYFTQILSRVREHLGESNQILGSFMCQGRMPMTVRNRYEGMLTAQPEKARGLMDNFDKASSHPDEEDYINLGNRVEEFLKQYT